MPVGEPAMDGAATAFYFPLPALTLLPLVVAGLRVPQRAARCTA